MARQRKLKRLAVLWLALGLVAAVLLTGIAFTYAEIYGLEEIAAAEGIQIHYVSADAIEAYTGRRANGFYDLCDNFIAVDAAQKLNTRILAHELGHYYAIVLFSNKSEDAADKIGSGLLLHGAGFVKRLKMGFDYDHKNPE